MLKKIFRKNVDKTCAKCYDKGTKTKCRQAKEIFKMFSNNQNPYAIRIPAFTFELDETMLKDFIAQPDVRGSIEHALAGREVFKQEIRCVALSYMESIELFRAMPETRETYHAMQSIIGEIAHIIVEVFFDLFPCMVEVDYEGEHFRAFVSDEEFNAGEEKAKKKGLTDNATLYELSKCWAYELYDADCPIIENFTKLTTCAYC